MKIQQPKDFYLSFIFELVFILPMHPLQVCQASLPLPLALALPFPLLICLKHVIQLFCDTEIIKLACEVMLKLCLLNHSCNLFS